MKTTKQPSLLSLSLLSLFLLSLFALLTTACTSAPATMDVSRVDDGAFVNQ